MSIGVRRSGIALGVGDRPPQALGSFPDSAGVSENPNGVRGRVPADKVRVFVAVENRFLQDALARMLTKRADIEVTGLNNSLPFDTEKLVHDKIDLLLLTSFGNLAQDLLLVREVRDTAPKVRIILLGMTADESTFLQCLRAGINGYLLQEASAEEVLAGVRAVQAGQAVCPGSLCAFLFRYFESELAALPSSTIRQRLGLTRREQQIIPLIAKGLTNKEIANHFCLSEQTVKNHLYRMKSKVGADDRLSIVQLCRTQGFLI
jgi:DNA-binding NarL/FixJ family response regulator